MKKKWLIIASLLAVVIAGVVILALNLNREELVEETPVDETLLNGFENNKDLYALYPTEIAPTDEYKACINTDSQYVKVGEGSFKYTFVKGSAHSFIQLLNHSNNPELDVTKLKAVSLWVYNDAETQQKMTLSLTTDSGAPLFSVQQELEPKAWTEVKYDKLGEYSYKKKANIGGVLFRFDLEGDATLYVDEMRVELGAEDIPPENFNDVVSAMASFAPDTTLNGDNFEQYIKFIDAVYYANQLYSDLDSTAGYEASYAKLQEYEQLLGGFAPIYTPRSDEDVISKWEYGNGLTIGQEVDETYGGVWSVIVDAKFFAEQSFKFMDVDTTAYGEAIMWIYNPTEYELTFQIHGGWNLWAAYATTLTPNDWTMVRFNTSIIENDTQGCFFPIISNKGTGFSGTFLFSGIYGIPAEISAADVIEAIAQLPSAAEITLEDKDTIEKIRDAYEELSRAGKAAVSNYALLTAAENKIATIEAENFDRKIGEVVSVPVTADNALERYRLVVDLTNEYNALSDLAYYRVTRWAEVEAYQQQINVHKAQLVKDLVNSMPAAEEAEFPKLLPQVNTAKELFETLTEQEKANIDVEKLNQLVALANNYIPAFDFTVENSDKVSITTDFGNGWQGSIGYVTDSTYGNIMVCDVKSGHSNATTQAEFRLRAYDKIYQYEKICFYVYAPTAGAKLVVYSENWKKHQDISLAEGQWTLVEIDTSFPTTDNMDGMFFIFTASSVDNLVGKWKVSSVYAYFDQQKTDEIVNAFVSAVDQISDPVTLADKAAIETARALYDNMPEYCKGYLPADLLKKLTNAESALERLEASPVIDTFLANANALGNGSTGQQIFDAWMEYRALGKFQSEVSEELVDKIKTLMTAKAAEVAQACDGAVAQFYTGHDFPRDVAKFKEFYGILNDMPKEVIGQISQAAKAQLQELYTDAGKYKTAETGIRPSDIVTDEQYGTAYRYTITNTAITGWDGCVLKLPANVAKNGNVVLYVYRPEGGADANLKVAMDGPWEEPEDLKVSITGDGWTRIEFRADKINTGRDCYFYLFTASEEVPSQSGWLISELYYY